MQKILRQDYFYTTHGGEPSSLVPTTIATPHQPHHYQPTTLAGSVRGGATWGALESLLQRCSREHRTRSVGRPKSAGRCSVVESFGFGLLLLRGISGWTWRSFELCGCCCWSEYQFKFRLNGSTALKPTKRWWWLGEESRVVLKCIPRPFVCKRRNQYHCSVPLLHSEPI